MSRFINKLVARHLEPEHNVKPILTGMYHAVPGQAPLKVEEEGDAVDEPGGVRARGGPVADVVREAGRGVDEQDVDGGRLELPRKGGEEIGHPVIRRDEIKRESGKGGRQEETVKPESSEKTGEPVKERVKYIERVRVAHEERGMLRDDMGEALPGQAVKTQSIVREAPVEPVLRDMNEAIAMVQPGGEQQRTEVHMPGVIKTRTNNIFQTKEVPARQTIHVSIGRIEIKATAPAPESKVTPLKKDTNIMGLDRFLEQRNPAKR